MSLRIQTLKGGFDDNFTYVVAPENGPIGLIVDAALPPEQVEPAVEALGVVPLFLVLTHVHKDHVEHAMALQETWPGMLVAAHEDAGKPFARDKAAYFPLEDRTLFGVGMPGQLEFDVIHTPGHSPHDICLLSPPALITGDTLFVGRTGRTRGENSDARTRQLYRSLQALTERVAQHCGGQIPADLTIYPGHDYGPTPTDTLANQVATNPFLQADSEDAFVQVMADYEASRA